MSKALTIDAIEQSATEVFCRDGFDRASLRDIASHAGVSLSAIHEYFDSKVALYIHVGKKLFVRLEAERRSALERRRGETALTLEAVVYGMVAPVLLTREAEDGTVWTPAQLKTWYDTTAYLENYPGFKEELRNATSAWVELLRQCSPGLSFADGLFAYSLVSAMMLNWDSTQHYLTGALSLAPRRLPEQEAELLVRILTAGIRDLAK